VSTPDPSARRQSNEDWRKVDLDEWVLIYLTRIKRKGSFKELGYLYGCGKASEQRYYQEFLELSSKHMVPRLVFPRSPEQLSEMADQNTLERFADLLGVFDATNWQQLTFCCISVSIW
jgi:hypothetical protein